MIDLDIAMREIEETKDDLAALVISDSFRCELSRIREDLAIPHNVCLTDEMMKWVLLANKRSRKVYNDNQAMG